MEIVYQPGKEQKADCLSRVPVSTIQAVFSSVEIWIKAQRDDKLGKEIFDNLKTEKYKDKYKLLDDGLLATIDGRVYVPKELREEVLFLNHDHKLASHLGIAKTLARIVKRYFWPGLHADVTAHVKACLICAKYKSQGTHRAPLQPLPIEGKVWGMMSLDILGPLPLTARNNRYILVLIDFATRFVILCAMVDQTAKTVAKHFVNDVILIFGCPERILSDQGRQFMSDFFGHVCSRCNIKQLRTTSYHPMGNGACERQNRTIVSMVSCCAADHPEDWDEILGFSKLALNTSRHSGTHFSSFYLNLGRDALLPSDLTPRESRSLGEDGYGITDKWQKALAMSQDNFAESQIVQKNYYDRNTTTKEFEEGQHVLLRLPPMPGKFVPKYTGPFRIIRKFSPLVYEIRKLESGHTTIVHFNRLKRWEGKVDLNENITHRNRPNTSEEGRKVEVQSQGAPKRIRGRPRKVQATKATSPVRKTRNLREPSISVTRPAKRRGRPPRENGRQNKTDVAVPVSEAPSTLVRSHKMSSSTVVKDSRNAWVPRYALRSRANRP